MAHGVFWNRAWLVVGTMNLPLQDRWFPNSNVNVGSLRNWTGTPVLMQEAGWEGT